MDRNKPNANDPESRSSRSQYGEPRSLNLNRKIFLSHSGKDKNFVRFLYEKLRDQYHDVTFFFFDEQSLPRAEPISMENILTEARGCELGVLVLSEDFFTHSPNPMRELEALTANEVRLLPLFYKISVDVFNKMRCENVWEKQWKEWKFVVNEGKIEVWRRALGFVNAFSGLEYCKLATNEPDYIRMIVSKMICIIPPAISFSKEGVCGMARLCKIVNRMYNRCAFKRAFDGCTLQVASTSASATCREHSGHTLDLVGIYGFAGLGKTTLCQSLCDFYFAEFHGKVCWIDLGSIPSDQASSQTHSPNAFRIRMKHLLWSLAGHIDTIDYLTHHQVESLVRIQIKNMDPIFLAIDNILPYEKSLDEARFYLSCEFPKGSKICITSRSEKLLEHVVGEYTKFAVVIEHIPRLKLKEARRIFMHEFANLQVLDVEDEVLKECVNMCIIYRHFHFHDEHKWYHPFMLKSLAASINGDRRRNVDWTSRLRELRRLAASVDKSDAWKTVFSMLNHTYEVLRAEAQTMFLDLALLYRLSGEGHYVSYEWIRSVYTHFSEKRVE